MEKVEFSPQEKSQIVKKVKLYFQEELEQEIGSFDAEFLIDFFEERRIPVFKIQWISGTK